MLVAADFTTVFKIYFDTNLQRLRGGCVRWFASQNRLLEPAVTWTVNCYFRSSNVSLNLCKEYLNVMTCVISLSADKELNILIYRTPFYVIIYRSYNLLKWFGFWPNL